MKKLLAAVALLFPLGLIALPVAANASDAACPGNGHGSSTSCTQIVSLYPSGGNNLNVQGGVAANGTPVVGYAQTTDGHEDFTPVWAGVYGAYTLYQFKYTPKGVASGYCLSMPSMAMGTSLILKKCVTGGNEYQSFVVTTGYKYGGTMVPEGALILGEDYTTTMDSTANGSNIDLIPSASSPTDNQEFDFTAVGLNNGV